MKKTLYKYISVLTLLVSIYSCQLTEELDDYEPLYSLDAEDAIDTQETAELALVGAYSGFTQRSLGSPFPDMFIIPDVLSGYSTVGRIFSSDPEEAAFIQNDPISTGTVRTLNIYTGLYEFINRTNWIISTVEELDDDIFEPKVRRIEIIAEAKILRALGHFYLLRNFGQFYDINSKYGINTRLEPSKSAKAYSRDSVLETYETILKDLEYGIENGPSLRTKGYTNSTFAKGLKARVLLYMQRYSEAANVAKEIIESSSSNFSLEPTFLSIFDDHESSIIFQSSEILFGTRGEPAATIGMGSYYSGFFATITQDYLDAVNGSLNVNGQIIDIGGSERTEEIFFPNSSYGGYYSTKYTSNFTDGDYDMIYHMRMAEVYLIFAEANARANNVVTPEALEALNTIRLRAGATSTGEDGFNTYPTSISLDQFLTAVRYEKLAELYSEGGETWYDLIRYDYSDGFNSGFQVSDVKASATDPDKFILPIPTETIDAGGNVIIQNPGYDD
ncbi:RagB/SusD family nutrient uptake outer membrane protein [Zunongwangia sp. HRR-M8]|uniref:RagB/SusD family nutrient uptake outer membrane protein n=1 Tax=Zunongwangia sp. HRR-M8 TaxID=3015170 RepID=UPI0022DD9BA5|nr:RagB/SusD family nutrient uptake outer membrane protein [Zunongwangia sp. HRR-M8]WBL21484.1 RagB/SusD family nutrient uptake outer membrane protein [Zunongwangia sp. HRR-M8]